MIKKIFVVVMLLAFAAWYFLRPGTLAPKPAGAADRTAEPLQEHSIFDMAQARTPKKLNVGKDDEILALKSGASIREQMPSLNEVRNEKQKDPEATPSPLLRFSIVLNSKLKLAMKSEAAGRVVMSQLQDCALSSESETTRSVAAMCLMNAHKIANKYASLSPEAEAIETHVDKKTLSIYQSMLKLDAK